LGYGNSVEQLHYPNITRENNYYCRPIANCHIAEMSPIHHVTPLTRCLATVTVSGISTKKHTDTYIRTDNRQDRRAVLERRLPLC